MIAINYRLSPRRIGGAFVFPPKGKIVATIGKIFATIKLVSATIEKIVATIKLTLLP
ncbi:hypothetical protein J7K99_07390 [bacterium]|nr:hypothetical protein [bacterium]